MQNVWLAPQCEHHDSWQQSALNQREYCEALGIPLKAYGNWRARFKAEPQPPSPNLLYRRRGLMTSEGILVDRSVIPSHFFIAIGGRYGRHFTGHHDFFCVSRNEKGPATHAGL